jgi:DNA-binding response OmpR family regulator
MATILTVDDDVLAQVLLKKGLTKLGHTIIQAFNRKNALPLAYWRKIDIVLLDMTMPGVSGLEILRQLKKTRRTQHIPVVMLTEHDDDTFRGQASFDYADDYILKTATFRAIESKLTRVLANRTELPAGWPTVMRW